MTAAYIPDDPALYGEMLAACRSLLLDAAADDAQGREGCGAGQDQCDKDDLQLPRTGPGDETDIAKGICPICHERYLRIPAGAADGYSTLL